MTGEQGESASQSDFGAISDDGSTLNMEAGHKVYSIPDSDDEKVVWKSSNESVVTVDETGLVTAVSDGDAILTATDEAGNELEQRTVIVGAVQELPEEAMIDTPEETVQPEPEEQQDQVEETQIQPEQKESPVSDTETSAGHLWVAFAALAAVVVCVAVIVVKKKRKK